MTAALGRRDDRPWARYSRLSTLADGSALKIEDQDADSVRYAEDNDIPISDEYVFSDNLTAWKKGAPRPGWDDLMAVAATGAIGGVIVPAVDRFTRRPRDMEDMIDLAEERGVKIAGPRAGRIDLTTPSGRQQARWLAGQAAAESDNTSARIKSRMTNLMAAGKPMGGGRSFGFEKGGQVQRPDEVKILREIARRMLDGETLKDLAEELNNRGVATTRGGPWTSANLGRMLRLHRYGGHVTHMQSLDPTDPKKKTMVFVGRIPAQYGEPVFDEDTYQAVQAMMGARRRGPRPSGRFVLTGIAKCGREGCGESLNGAHNQTRLLNGTYPREYRCPIQRGGCGLTIRADALEDTVATHMTGLLFDVNTNRALAQREQQDEEKRAVYEQRLRTCEESREDITVKLALKEITETAFQKANQALIRRENKTRQEMQALATVAPTTPIPLPEEWEDMTVDEKRITIARYRVEITVHPLLPDGPRNKVDPRRIEIR